MTKNLYIPLPHRTAIRISGSDRATFLQGLISNNIEKASDTQAIYALMLTPQGKFLYDFFIVTQDESHLLDIPAAHKDTILKKLKMYKLRSDVIIEDLSDTHECSALLGENVWAEIEEKTAGLIHGFCKGVAYSDPRSTKLFARSFIEKENHYQSFEAKEFSKGNIEDYERLRITAAIPSADEDMISEKSFPLDFGFDKLGAIDFNKGCYVGQEVTARMHHRSDLKKALYQVKTDTASSLPASGSAVTADGHKLGELRSSVGHIGLALLRKEEVDKYINTPTHSDGITITEINPVFV